MSYAIWLKHQNCHSGDVQFHVFKYSVMHMNMTACWTLHTSYKLLVTVYRCTMSYAIWLKQQKCHLGDVQLHVFTYSAMYMNMTPCCTFHTGYKLLVTDFKCTMSYAIWLKLQICHLGDVQLHVFTYSVMHMNMTPCCTYHTIGKL